MSNKGKKFISDQRLIRSEDFTRLIESLDIESLSSLLDSQPFLINKRDEKTGLSLLFRAVMNENYEMSEYLLESGADPNIQNIIGETPLQNAVENSNHKLINLLLEKGADPNIQQMDGETPMHIAALQGDYKVIKLLNLYGADPNLVTFEYKYKPLDYAQKRGDQKSLKVLVSIMEKQISDNSIDNSSFKTGIQTAKNSEGNFDRMKNNVNLQMDYPLFSMPYNNTTKNCQIAYHKRNISHYPISPNNISKISLNEVNIDNNNLKNVAYPSKEALRKERHTSYNVNTYNINTIDTITNHHISSPNNIEDTEVNNNYIYKDSILLDQMNSLERRFEKIKKALIENLISNSDININTMSDHPVATLCNSYENNSNNYPNYSEVANYKNMEAGNCNEEGLYNYYYTHNECNYNKPEQINSNMINEYGSNVTPYLRSNSINNASDNVTSPTNNSNNNYSSNSFRIVSKFNISKKYGYDTNSLPTNLNYENLINSHNSRKNQNSHPITYQQNIYSHSHSNLNDQYNNENFNDSLDYSNNNQYQILNVNPKYEITLRNNNMNLNDAHEIEEDIHSSRITYLTDRMNEKKNQDEVFNLPLKRNLKQSIFFNSDENSSFSNSKGTRLNASDNNSRLAMHEVHPVECFEDFSNKVLAVFFSSKNDIKEIFSNNESSNLYTNSKFKKSCENLNLNKKDSDMQKYSELFNFDIEEMNEFIKNTEIEIEENEEEDLEEEDKQIDDSIIEKIQQDNIKNFENTSGTFYSRKFTFNNLNLHDQQMGKYESINNSMYPNNNNSNIIYFSKSLSQFKDEFRQISLDTNNYEISLNCTNLINESDKNIISNETLDKMNLNFENFDIKKGSGLIEMEYYSTEAIKEINTFLKAIELEFYTPLFIKNGFDDLKSIIEQMKSDMAISDQNLRDIGIHIPGHRAKILIKLEEECNNFGFALPHSVYYSLPDSKDNVDIDADFNFKSLFKWLTGVKLEQFADNFINSGYHSIELLLMQMNSKNVLTEKILEEEIGVDKIGYRIRILNKLRDDAKNYSNKLKSRMKVSVKKENNPESCSRCMIF